MSRDVLRGDRNDWRIDVLYLRVQAVLRCVLTAVHFEHGGAVLAKQIPEYSTTLDRCRIVECFGEPGTLWWSMRRLRERRDRKRHEVQSPRYVRNRIKGMWSRKTRSGRVWGIQTSQLTL